MHIATHHWREGRDEQYSILDRFGNRAGAFGYRLCLSAIDPA